MGNTIFKVYEPEAILPHYFVRDGIPYLINGQGDNKDKVYENELIKPLPVVETITEESIIDPLIEKAFLEDVDIPENETDDVRINRIKRYQKIVKMLKQKFSNRCQLCKYTFLMDNGNSYSEAHHIKMLSKDGAQNPDNVIILCANHHRMFHYASSTTKIGELIDGRRIITIQNEEYVVEFLISSRVE